MTSVQRNMAILQTGVFMRSLSLVLPVGHAITLQGIDSADANHANKKTSDDGKD